MTGRGDEWRAFPRLQPIHYADKEKLNSVLHRLSSMPPLVSVEEIEELKKRLRGKEFIVHIGECAEDFDNCTAAYLSDFVRLLECADVLGPTVKIARIAGQYAKPRTKEHEAQQLVFRGHAVNSKSAREHDPQRMIAAYFYSTATMNYLRTLGKIFISHEAFLLEYDSSLTVQQMNLSAHFVWCGDRTRELGFAHIEYLRRLKNPVGIKLSSKITPLLLAQLVNVFDTVVVLICRLGVDNLTVLPSLINAVRHKEVLWTCDPMHGNTREINGVKTRYLKDIEGELTANFEIHFANNSRLNGVHLEATPLNVTECVGLNVGENNILENYKTLCDPRLNMHQTIHVFAHIRDLMDKYKPD